MNRKIPIIISLVLAIVLTAVIVVSARKDYTTVSETVEVATASKYIPTGAVLSEDNIGKVSILKSASQGMLGYEEALGKTASVSMIKGQHIYRDAVSEIKPTRAGYVEILIETDLAKSAYALPGEKVNVHFLTQEVQGGYVEGIPEPEAPLTLQGVTVLRTLNSDAVDISQSRTNLLEAIDGTPAVIGLEIPEEKAEQVVYYASNKAIYLTKVNPKEK